MKKTHFALFAMFVLSFIPTLASAQMNEVVRAKIPFAFYAGGKQLPAGSYDIRVSDDQRRLLLQNAGGEPVAFAIALPVSSDRVQAPSMRFDKLGDTYFLRSANGLNAEYDLGKSRQERDLGRERDVAQITIPTAGI